MMKQKFRKSQLSLALATALSGGLLASSPAQAVWLNNNDRIGDAGIFQYYTVQEGWQTFFRIINTSDEAAAVKLRFHEAANSRDVLDFLVFLSPRDEWVAWTDANALNNGTGPGIRTNDTSCLYPRVGSSTIPYEGWKDVTGVSGVRGARFVDKAFTGAYDDNAGVANPVLADPVVRMSEGYLEVIGIASYKDGSTFDHDVSHGDDGLPENCAGARDAFERKSGYWKDGDDHDMRNALAFNGYLINVNAGQGGGYDPDVLADFAHDSLVKEALETDTKPNFDSADPDGFAYPTKKWGQKVAINQREATGNAATTYVYQVDINGNGAYGDTVGYDVDGNGMCEDGEQSVSESDAPASATTGVLAQVSTFKKDDKDVPCYGHVLGTPTGSNKYHNGALTDDGGPSWYPSVSPTPTIADKENPARWAQNGKAENLPVRGGVDAVSWEILRNGVINEWAASFNAGNIVRDYYTQWVLTFPTKNFYVDMAEDKQPQGVDDISPTLVPQPMEYAFAPFTEQFKGGHEPGTSCDAYTMNMWDREEQDAAYTSPQEGYPAAVCYETNVVNFGDAYVDAGLKSKYAITVPSELLPPGPDGISPSQRGWAQMSFAYDIEGVDVVNAEDPNDVVGAQAGLIAPKPSWFNSRYDYEVGFGLPVTGFMFSVYNTNDAGRNHAAINAHKYDRITCDFDLEDNNEAHCH